MSFLQLACSDKIFGKKAKQIVRHFTCFLDINIHKIEDVNCRIAGDKKLYMKKTANSVLSI